MIVALRSVKKHFVFWLRVVRVNASALALARQDSLWTKLHGRLHRPPSSKSGTLSKRETGWHREGYAAEAAGLLRSTKNTSVESFFLRHTHNICRCVP